jgi:uncharacterized protein (DUF3084 family)
VSDGDDLHRRVSKLEDQHDRLLESTQQLVVSTRLLTENITQLSDIIKELKALEPRIRQMEMDVNNNKLMSRALVWLGTTAGSAAVIMFITYLANLGR